MRENSVCTCVCVRACARAARGGHSKAKDKGHLFLLLGWQGIQSLFEIP